LCLFDVWLERKQATLANRQTQYWRLRTRHLTLPNGAKTQYVSSADLKAVRAAIREASALWAIARGRKITELKRDIKNTERRIAALIKRAQTRGILIRNVLGDPDSSVDYYTPPEYIDLVRQVLGTIDLDPASNDVAQSWIRAEVYYTKQDDGLTQPWYGNLYINPPYGSPEVRLMAQRFFEKAIACYKSGTIKAAILLLNRTEAGWYKALQQKVTAVCEVTKRISFIDENGIPQQSPRYYSDFLYLGQEREKFREVFNRIGEVKIIP
jgi:hypothetical protein